MPCALVWDRPYYDWAALQVLAKSAMLSYERFRIVRDVVNVTWHGAKYWDAWEFDYVCLNKKGALQVAKLIGWETSRSHASHTCKHCMSNSTCVA